MTLTKAEYVDKMLNDLETSNQILTPIMEVAQMSGRLNRQDLSAKYYLLAFLAISRQDEAKTESEHQQHLNRFIMSHVRINHDMLRLAKEEPNKPDPYRHTPRTNA